MTATDRILDGAPRHFAALDVDGELAAYVSSLGDQVDEVIMIVDGADPDVGDGSDLVAPPLVDAARLPWLAALLGLDPDRLAAGIAGTMAQYPTDFATIADLNAAFPTMAALNAHGLTGDATTPEEMRTALANAPEARYAGSRRSYRAAIQPYLTGTLTVIFTTHIGGEWAHVRVETYTSETPSPAAVEAVVGRMSAPAGVLVEYQTRTGSTIAALNAAFDTVADVDAAFITMEEMAEFVPSGGP